jgi:putative PIG3 family NAD(P)H quinone oxidoreductase
MAEAAALPEACFTVWANVVEQGGLKPGERFLVHGGSSGIGTTAIQLARSLGVEVFTTAGSAEKCAFCESLGARAINYKESDFKEALQRLTGGQGIDLILDMVGGPYLSRNLDSLAPGGRLVIIAVQGGPKADINLLPIMLKRLTVSGSTLRPRSLEEKTALAAALRQHVWPRLESGQIRPIIHAVFPLTDAAEAHRLMESSRHIGKIVLTVNPTEYPSC